MAPDDPTLSPDEGEEQPRDAEDESQPASSGEAKDAPEEPESTNDDLGPVDQSAIDALLSDMESSAESDPEEGEAKSAADDEPLASAPSTADTATPVDEGASPLEEPSAEEGPAPEEEAPVAEGASSAEAEAPAEQDSQSQEEESPAQDDGLLDQSELDALIADFQKGEAEVTKVAAEERKKAKAEAAAESPAPLPPMPEGSDEPSERQSGIDSILAQAVQEAAGVEGEESSAEAATEAADADEDETLETEIEAVLLDLEESDVEEPVDESQQQSTRVPDESAVEDLPSSEASVAESSLEPEDLLPEAEQKSDDPSPDSTETDDSLTAEGAPDDTLVRDEMDDRLDASLPEFIEDEVEPAAVESAAASAETEDAAFEMDRTPAEEDPATVLERVASENIAAGAVENAAVEGQAVPVVDEECSAALASLEVTEIASDEPVPISDRPGEVEDLSASTDSDSGVGDDSVDAEQPLLLIFKQSPIRTGASVAAGVLFALSAFTYLYTNQLREVPDIGIILSHDLDNLNRAMLHARELLSEERPAEALQLLDDVLMRTPPAAPGVDEARYLRLESLFAGLPETLSMPVANRMHDEIDRLVDESRSNPRVSEALYWKAKVYERGGNPIAARAEYRGILENLGRASNVDQVLLALAELLLEAERPLKAANPLRRLLQDFPGSRLAPRARLLLGDAYALAGDPESATTVYIRLAQEQPDTSVGALAFERIGKLALETGSYTDAIRELKTRLEMATTIEGNDRIHLLLGKAYRASGEWQMARDTLSVLLDFFPESQVTPGALVELSRVMNDMGLGREALRMATQAALRFPDNIEVLRNAGTLLRESGDAFAAAQVLLAADSAGANDAELLLSAGRLFREAGASSDAEAVLERLLTTFPTSSQAWQGSVEWAWVLYEEGEIERALGRLEDLLVATDGQTRRLPLLKATGEMYRDLGLLGRMVRAYTQIAGLTEDPALLAEASIALIQADAPDVAMRVAERVDPARLDANIAYSFLMSKAEIWMRRDSVGALELMEEAHEAYPSERTREGVQLLLEANLTVGKTARARALVSELQQRASQPEFADEWPWLERAAISWGDHLFIRGDYRAAAGAYAIALEPVLKAQASQSEGTLARTLTEPQLWGMYQQANAYYALARFQETLDLFDEVAASSSKWAKDAAANAVSARIEIRLRGDPVAETRDTG